MSSLFLNIIFQYGGLLLGAITFFLICKAYLASKVQDKIRRYQSEIVKSHAKILELEVENDKLANRLKDVEGRFIKNQLIMN